MILKSKRLAFLAPEIPALSATFVYNEILNLENKGIEVVPVSIHIPKSPAKEPEADKLGKRTKYLYANSFWYLALINSIFSLKNPILYFKTLLLVFQDIKKCGFLNRISAGLLYRFFFAPILANIVKDENCDHLHCHFAHVSADIAMYASSLAKVPFSFTAHANDIFERNWLLEEKIKRSIFAITISNFNKDYLISLGGEPEKIHVVYCGVDADIFGRPLTVDANIIPRIGSLGRIVEKKGFDVLIGACKKMKEENTPFHLEIAGDGPLKKECQKKVEIYGLQSHVSFIGELPHSAVPKWLQGLDAFVLACRKDRNNDMDGIPVVLMEAMMSYVPVVSTRISGIPELVEDEKTGFLAEPEDPSSLANAITKALGEFVQRINICDNALKHVNENFNLRKNTNSLLRHIERVTS